MSLRFKAGRVASAVAAVAEAVAVDAVVAVVEFGGLNASWGRGA